MIATLLLLGVLTQIAGNNPGITSRITGGALSFDTNILNNGGDEPLPVDPGASDGIDWTGLKIGGCVGLVSGTNYRFVLGIVVGQEGPWRRNYILFVHRMLRIASDLGNDRLGCRAGGTGAWGAGALRKYGYLFCSDGKVPAYTSGVLDSRGRGLGSPDWARAPAANILLPRTSRMTEPIRTWHLLFRGFRQTEGDLSGVQRLWRELLRQHGGPDTMVDCRAWHEDVAEIAENICVHANGSTPPVICLYGYSWGGMTAVTLARQLNRRGLDVRHVVLSDAVYRHWYMLGQWRAMVPYSQILIPGNVQEVSWLRQTFNWPRGHQLVAEDANKTIIHKPIIMTAVAHAYMDDLAAFYSLAMRVARGQSPFREGM